MMNFAWFSHKSLLLTEIADYIGVVKHDKHRLSFTIILFIRIKGVKALTVKHNYESSGNIIITILDYPARKHKCAYSCKFSIDC